MSASVRLWLNHFPPSDGHRYIVTRAGRYVLTQETREFYNLMICWAAKQRVAPHVPGWVVVEKYICWPDRRKRDPSNLNKCLLDGLVKAGAIEDDCKALVRDMQVRVWADGKSQWFSVVIDDGGRYDAIVIDEPGLLVVVRPAGILDVPGGCDPEQLRASGETFHLSGVKA